MNENGFTFFVNKNFSELSKASIQTKSPFFLSHLRNGKERAMNLHDPLKIHFLGLFWLGQFIYIVFHIRLHKVTIICIHPSYKRLNSSNPIMFVPIIQMGLALSPLSAHPRERLTRKAFSPPGPLISCPFPSLPRLFPPSPVANVH